MSSGQLTFDLPLRPALGASDFLIGPSNRAAVDMIDLWPDWPQASVAVVAPSHAGKTHLANVWLLRSGAARLNAGALQEADVPPATAHGAVLVEDLHAGIADERALFHLLNAVREHKLTMLLTSRTPPGELEVHLPDLRSRLRALPVVAIAPPDEVLLRAVLVKLFIDRQLTVEPGLIGYLANRMERSMEAAATLVAEIDRAAMVSHRKVTRALAANVLEGLAKATDSGTSDRDSPASC